MPLFTTPKRRCFALALGLVLVTAWVWWRCARNPNVYFLSRHAGAEWIVFPSAPEINLHRAANWTGTFRRTFVLDAVPQHAEISWRAFLNGTLAINDDILTTNAGVDGNWKLPQSVEVTSRLRAGTNEIVVSVLNAHGPPALWLHWQAGQMQFGTDGLWEVSLAGSAWRPAELARAERQLRAGNLLYSTENMPAAFAESWPALLVFAIIATAAWFAFTRSGKIGESVALAAVLAVWPALIWNNVDLLPVPTLGYDTEYHVEYVQFILDHGRIPFADQGFQMFQPPLFYLVGAGALSLFSLDTASAHGLMLLRAIGIAFGVLHAVCIVLATRLVFPGRRGARVLAACVGALVPMLLYLSFYITNEAPMAALVAVAILICLRMLKTNELSIPWSAALGVGLGAALLTKISALVALPVIVLALAGRLFSERRPISDWARSLGVMMAACVLVCGWYYVLVWQRFGSPIILSWDHAGGFSWWQAMGYQTRDFFLRGGEVFHRPFCSGINSFGDGLYTTLWGDGLWSGISVLDFRPPWNYSMAHLGYTIAVVPAALILFGAVKLLLRWFRHPEAQTFLLLGVALAYLAAIAFICLKAPYIASVKAFYGLSALIPLAVFAVHGWMSVAKRNRSAGMICAVLVILSALNGVAALWVRRDAPETELCLALHANAAGKVDLALRRLIAAAKRFPNEGKIARQIATLLSDSGEHTNALAWAERAVQLFPGDMLCAERLAEELRHTGELEKAMTMFRSIIEANPDFRIAHYQLASSLAQAKHFAPAWEAVREGLAASPADRQLHTLAGSLAFTLNDFAAAESHLRLAIEFGEAAPATRTMFATVLMQRNKTGEAIEQLTSVTRQRSDDAGAFALLGAAQANAARYHEAAANFETALRGLPDSPVLLNNLAWLRATCPDQALRNGNEAVRLAQLACRLTNEREPQFLGTLAAAHAEAGQFAEAIAACRKAIALAEAATNEPVAGRNRELLQLYLEGKPYREAVNRSAAP